jgi:23S rRNA pseudouridine2605 synthase
MRINKFLAQATGISRRAADTAVGQGAVLVNGSPASTGQIIVEADVVTYQQKQYQLSDVASDTTKTIILNKPAGFVVSRNGQGSKIIYALLPPTLHTLKPVGRLDKDSSGLLLLTNDGDLAHKLTHPSFNKVKRYEIALDKPLQPLHRQMISEFGLQLEDGLSRLQLDRLDPPSATGTTSRSQLPDADWLVTMHQGRNRQIRRTFASLGYEVVRLHRTQFGDYLLNDLKSGSYTVV